MGIDVKYVTREKKAMRGTAMSAPLKLYTVR